MPSFRLFLGTFLLILAVISWSKVAKFVTDEPGKPQIISIKFIVSDYTPFQTFSGAFFVDWAASLKDEEIANTFFYQSSTFSTDPKCECVLNTIPT